uniref:Uncharacterized protein n=1 Tax=Oryza sativa subsp. japonica TaxID=39947 RepID=Q6ZG67_ORYSJ|nr:unknown protein [Oryza sativa Japonica Group]
MSRLLDCFTNIKDRWDPWTPPVTSYLWPPHPNHHGRPNHPAHVAAKSATPASRARNCRRGHDPLHVLHHFPLTPRENRRRATSTPPHDAASTPTPVAAHPGPSHSLPGLYKSSPGHTLPFHLLPELPAPFPALPMCAPAPSLVGGLQPRATAAPAAAVLRRLHCWLRHRAGKLGLHSISPFHRRNSISTIKPSHCPFNRLQLPATATLATAAPRRCHLRVRHVVPRPGRHSTRPFHRLRTVSTVDPSSTTACVASSHRSSPRQPSPRKSAATLGFAALPRTLAATPDPQTITGAPVPLPTRATTTSIASGGLSLLSSVAARGLTPLSLLPRATTLPGRPLTCRAGAAIAVVVVVLPCAGHRHLALGNVSYRQPEALLHLLPSARGLSLARPYDQVAAMRGFRL